MNERHTPLYSKKNVSLLWFLTICLMTGVLLLFLKLVGRLVDVLLLWRRATSPCPCSGGGGGGGAHATSGAQMADEAGAGGRERRRRLLCRFSYAPSACYNEENGRDLNSDSRYRPRCFQRHLFKITKQYRRMSVYLKHYAWMLLVMTARYGAN